MARSKLTAKLILTLVPLALCAGAAMADDAAPPAPQAAQISLLGPGLAVSDLAAALKFYRDGFGLVEVGRVPLGEREEIILATGTARMPPFLFLVGPKQGKDEALAAGKADRGRIVFTVADLQAARARLAAAGYSPGEIKTHEGSGTALFWASDPDGHRLEIVQPARPAESSE
ncbi:MAG: VOC family protein [Novosphingobium sp.]|nr:VOC family protein [Novosphingobium sp.]